MADNVEEDGDAAHHEPRNRAVVVANEPVDDGSVDNW